MDTLTWKNPKDAPHDELILADFGWPWPVPATWDNESQSWAAMSLQRQSDGEGVSLSAWFETEHERPEDLRRWASMPILPNTSAEKRDE